MNGNDFYEDRVRNKIENILKENSDKKYLRGFYNYMTDLSVNTIYDYIMYIINFIDKTNKPVEELNLDDYTEYLSFLTDKVTSYQITVYSALKKFSLYLKASGRNINDPMQYVNRPRFIEKEETKIKRENNYLEKKEIRKYLFDIECGVGSHRAKARQEDWKNRDKAIILTLLNTGMRCAALYKLNIDNINIEEKKLTTIDKGRKYQEYFLSDELLEVLTEWINERKVLLGDKNETALFISNRKTRMDQRSISRVVNKYASNIEGKHITPHKLRATYGTQLYAATKDLYFVQSCMGHSNPKTTELYIRGQKDSARQTASELMGKITF